MGQYELAQNIGDWVCVCENFRNHPPPNSTLDKLVGEYNLDDYVMPGDEKVRLHSSTYEQGKVLEWKKEPP